MQNEIKGLVYEFVTSIKDVQNTKIEDGSLGINFNQSNPIQQKLLIKVILKIVMFLFLGRI